MLAVIKEQANSNSGPTVSPGGMSPIPTKQGQVVSDDESSVNTTLLDESMRSLMSHDDHQKHQQDQHNNIDSIVSVSMTDEEEWLKLLLEDSAGNNLPSLVEDELVLLVVPEVCRAVSHDEDEDQPEDAAAVNTGSPLERPRSSLLSSMPGSIKGSPRPIRVKSADAASLKQRMQDVSSTSAHRNSNRAHSEDEKRSGGGEEQEMRDTRSISTKRHGRRLSSRETLSRSRTSYDPPATMEGLVDTKIPATGRPSPTKARPTRKKSSDSIGTKGSLRRNRTADARISRQASNSNALSRMSRMLRGPSSRNNSSTWNGMDNNKDAMSLRHTQTTDEPSLPRRNTRQSLPLRNNTKSFSDQLRRRTLASSSFTRPTAVSRTSLNIFGSDLISTDFILNQLDELDKNQDIVQVELEDCLVTKRALAIPLRLKEILVGDKTTLMRPWEGIHFVDELVLTSLDGAAVYKDFKRNRKHFVKALDGVCAQHVIPVSHKVKVHLTSQDDNVADDDDDDDNKHSNNTMVSLLQQFQLDAAVTTINMTTRKASLELVQAWTVLLQCDDRPWDTKMRLEVSCDDGAEPKEVAALGGLEPWHAAMNDAKEQLKKAMEAKGLAMPK